MPRSLHSDSKHDLDLASALGLAAVFNGLKPNLDRSEWLQPGNAYRLDCVQQIDQDVAGAGINSPHLAEYIAASIPLHCSDGWTFLARSLSCYINGNPNQAAHFAYYAELRAAMAILAAQGIGVFNDKHFVVTAAGDCRLIRKGRRTHDMAWLALEHWAQTTTSGDALLDLFAVSRFTIREWFQNRTGGPVAGSFANQWLKEWGLDLNVLGTDHLVRNASSYRPNDLAPFEADARACSNFLRNLWSLFQPSTNRFETLDRHLLRMLVKKGFVATGQAALSTNPRFVGYVNTMLAGLGMTDIERVQLSQFLTSPASEPDLLLKAETLGPAGDLNAHERVISRAALLLRVASGFTAKLIDTAVFRAEDLQFWTDPWAERRAFWAPGSPPDELTDLWRDVSDAVDEETDWITAQGVGVVSMSRWRAHRDEIIRPLTECDRVALWGLQR